MLREVVKRAIVSFAAVFIVSLGALSFVGCSVFATQQTVAAPPTLPRSAPAGVFFE
jgi:hypothetical protein